MAFINTEKGITDEKAAKWQKKIAAANKYYEDWEKKFKCKQLEEYYEGKQWKENDRYEPYVINLFFSSIEVKKPSLLFENPVFSVTPKPWKSDFNPDEAFALATLKSDTLNSFFCDSRMQFSEEIEYAILDSWSHFGIVEIGYGAEWIENPNANKPILASDYIDDSDPGDTLAQPEQIPEKEWLYVKRIPAHRFRVGGFDSKFLANNNWVGYYEFVRTEDLLAAGVSEEKLEFAGSRSFDFVYDKDENQVSQTGDLVKIWKIWDLRAKEHFILKDSPAVILFKPKKFKRLPLIDFRPIKRRKGFYPIPVTYNWKSPQDEINESHEMNRAHRRKARSLYQAQTDSVEEDEINKMTTAPDMSVLMTKRQDAIKPIENPRVDASLGVALQVSKDDFNIVSSTTAEQRGEADRTTATQAQLTNQRSSIRENAARQQVSKFLSRIGQEVLLQIREKFTLPFWITQNLDPLKDPAEAQQIQQTYSLISADELGDDDFEVNISVDSLSPVANEDEKRKLLEFLAILAQYPMIATSPNLIREIAFRVGYRNNKVIQELVQVAQLQLMTQMGAAGGGKPGNAGAAQAAQNTVANATPPAMEQIRQQLGM